MEKKEYIERKCNTKCIFSGKTGIFGDEIYCMCMGGYFSSNVNCPFGYGDSENIRRDLVPIEMLEQYPFLKSRKEELLKISDPVLKTIFGVTDVSDNFLENLSLEKYLVYHDTMKNILLDILNGSKDITVIWDGGHSSLRAEYIEHGIDDVPAADGVPWSWLEQYADSKRCNFASEFVSEARKKWENGEQDSD